MGIGPRRPNSKSPLPVDLFESTQNLSSYGHSRAPGMPDSIHTTSLAALSQIILPRKFYRFVKPPQEAIDPRASTREVCDAAPASFIVARATRAVRYCGGREVPQTWQPPQTSCAVISSIQRSYHRYSAAFRCATKSILLVPDVVPDCRRSSLTAASEISS